MALLAVTCTAAGSPSVGPLQRDSAHSAHLTSCRCSAVIHDEESWILIQCVWVCIDILYLVYIIYGVCVRTRSHDSGPQSEDLRIRRHCCTILMCLEH